eukprot:8900971-Karenia_brevis.AAC.1
MPRVPIPTVGLMKLSPNDWTERPKSLISLGDMLRMSGIPVEGREGPPPPQPGPDLSSAYVPSG